MEQVPRARDELPFRDVAPDAAVTLGPRHIHHVPMLGDPSPFGRSFMPDRPAAVFGHFTASGGPGSGAFDWGAPLPPLPSPADVESRWAPLPATDHSHRLTELEEKMTQAQNTIRQTELRLAVVEEQLRLVNARLDRVDRDTSAQHAMARAMKSDTEAILNELRKVDE